MLQSEIYLKWFIIYLLIINTISLFIFAWDKKQSRKGAWRIRERDLFLFAIIGGSLGELLGMSVFRHKTRHLKFKAGIPLILLLQVILIYYIML
jgi:uncharacterized membrane protein YsdA (DUF1294 family)